MKEYKIKLNLEWVIKAKNEDEAVSKLVKQFLENGELAEVIENFIWENVEVEVGG